MSQTGRRSFAAALGSLMLSPALLESATQEIRDTGAISRETTAAILELTGDTFTEAQMNRTRQALQMLIRDFEALRQFKIPPGTEPATCFRGR